MNPIQVALRSVQLLFTIIIMAIIGNMIASAFAGNPSIVNYDMFTVVFALLSLIYLFAAAIKEGLGHPIASVALDALNTLFWFIAGVATAAELGVHSCSSQDYINSNKITNGAADKGGRCREAQAATAFFWFGFAAFAASTVMSGLSGRK